MKWPQLTQSSNSTLSSEWWNDMKGKYLHRLEIFSVLHHYTVSQGKEKKIKPQQIQAISQGDTKAKDVLKSERVCSKHFVFGGPSPYLKKHNVDSVPTLELGKKSYGCEIDYEASAKRKDSDEKVCLYTGLPSLEVLMVVFDHVASHVKRQTQSLDRFQEFIIVLMKFRLNVPLKDLAYHFLVLISTISRIFFHLILVMDKRLFPFVYWPDRHQLWKTMPQCFQYAFGRKTTVVIDSFEVFIERPPNFLARANFFWLKTPQHQDSCWNNPTRNNFFCFGSLGRSCLWQICNWELWFPGKASSRRYGDAQTEIYNSGGYTANWLSDI